MLENVEASFKLNFEEMEVDMHEGLSPHKCPIRPAESPGRMSKYRGASPIIKTKPKRNHSPDQDK